MGVRELVQAPDGIPLTNHHVQQLIASWMGLAGDGSDAQLWGVPLRQTSVSDDTRYALDLRNRGAGGLHERITHSSGAPVLFEVTDAGITFGGTVAGIFAVGMILDWDSAATPPTGWSICDGTGGTPDLRDRFLVGAGTTYARGATGGATTANLLHHHTSAAHSHTMASHVHDQGSHSHGMQNHTHSLADHTHDMADHRHEYSHTHHFVHNHGGTTTGGPDTHHSNIATGGGGTITLPGNDHDHDIADESGSTDTTGGSAGFGNNEFTVSGNNSDDGYTSPGLRGYGGSPHFSVNTTDLDGAGATGVPSTNSTGSQSPGATAAANPNTSDSTTPTDSGDSLSATQSILPPYYALYKIRRMVA